MTKTDALNKAAQEFGYADFEDIKPKYHLEKLACLELKYIANRAMDIYAGGWISVEERLPEVAGYYLVVVDEKVASSRRGVVEIGDCYKTIYSGKKHYVFNLM